MPCALWKDMGLLMRIRPVHCWNYGWIGRRFIVRVAIVVRSIGIEDGQRIVLRRGSWDFSV